MSESSAAESAPQSSSRGTGDQSPQVLTGRRGGRQSDQASPPPRLTDSQIAALQRSSDEFRAAHAQVMEAVGVLWNAQIDMAMEVDDPDILSRALRRPLGLFDDCSCGPCGPIILSW